MRIDGKSIADNILKEVDGKVKSLSIAPKLKIILIGKDDASKIYVKVKTKACEKVGIDCEVITLPDTVVESEIIELIKKLNADASVNGILVQLPIPKHLNEETVVNAVTPSKDVDGLTLYNQGKLYSSSGSNIGNDFFIPATPQAVIKVLESIDINLEGKHAVIIGRSNLVGKPLAMLLLQRNCTVTICHSKTADLKKHTIEADIVISAVGKKDLVGADYVKKGVIAIDVGITRFENKLYGDFSSDVADVAEYITPVPGGVGPVTVACLLSNIVNL